jgi:urea transport system permease protein
MRRLLQLSCRGTPVSANILDRLRAVALSLLLIVAFAAPAFAGPFEDAVAKFANDDFSDTGDAIDAVASSGNPLAVPIIGALQEGRLIADPESKKVFIKQADDKIIDAATGAAVDKLPDGASEVRLNNRLRRTVATALGSLTLASPDPAKRIAAAQSVFKSHDENALPAVEEALARETNNAAKAAFTEARAAILLFKSDASESDKLEAIAVLKARGDQEAMALLTGLGSDLPPNVARAAASAIASIQSNLAMWSMVQNAWYGLSLGSVLLLAAIGLAITFGVMGVINMAHGEMVMLGAYTTFVVQESIRAKSIVLGFPGVLDVRIPLPFDIPLDLALPIAIPIAFVVTALIGILIERTIIRFLYGRPLETLLATWGLSLVLQQAVRTMFGPTNREVSNPTWMSGAFELGQITITYNRLWILCFTLAVFGLLLAMLRYTALGLEMRAVTQNRRMAASMGIATSRVDALTFGLGSGIAGIAGVALSQIDNVSPNLGQSYIIDSFMVVVFGGVGNLWGTLVGAFTLGIANKFLEPVAGAVLGKIAILVLIILFIQKRPRGLFALKGRAVEA